MRSSAAEKMIMFFSLVRTSTGHRHSQAQHCLDHHGVPRRQTTLRRSHRPSVVDKRRPAGSGHRRPMIDNITTSGAAVPSPKAKELTTALGGLATQEHLRLLALFDPAAPVDLVQRRVLPTGRVRLSCLATSLLRSRVRPLRCKGGRGRTVLRT
jgi:hypothetical protein